MSEETAQQMKVCDPQNEFYLPTNKEALMYGQVYHISNVYFDPQTLEVTWMCPLCESFNLSNHGNDLVKCGKCLSQFLLGVKKEASSPS